MNESIRPLKPLGMPRPLAGASRGPYAGRSAELPPTGASEADAVRARYARREPADPRYSLLDPAAMMAMQERQRELIRLLRLHGLKHLHTLRLLEVGSGVGSNLLELQRLGFVPERLSGIELLAERHESAVATLPSTVTLLNADATQAEVTPASQDLVLQSTVFSSLLDDAFQKRLADAMWRWLKPGGAVLWYDFTVNNPRNADVRGVPVSRMRKLFPLGRVEWRRITLAPPLARPLARLHPALYTAFNLLIPLRTHVMAWISKPL
ncbi:MAG: methyltransferase type 11 [Rhizobacter sp.]|nr:methyltransferase type 11 [Rhizobacter sp.]